MVIEIETNEVPSGTLGWTRLLEAIETADPTDETEWVEFKAGLAIDTKEGQAAVAKALVAFANRDPERAAKWFGGHAFVLIGIEPGNVQGTSVLDPARIHDGVQRLLQEPAPEWDLVYVTYKGHPVLVLTVAPPRPGDPIHCIAKSSGQVETGNVFVRQPGKSARATGQDMRRLSDRLVAGTRLGLGLDVQVTGESGYAVARSVWQGAWVDRWVTAERQRLIGPLEAEESSKNQHFPLGMGGSLDAMLRTTNAARALFEDPEDRDPEDYRASVEAYLDECRERLPGAPSEVQLFALPVMRFSVVNLTEENLEHLQVSVHIEGDVRLRERPHEPPNLRQFLPKAPRPWGPKPKAAFAHQFRPVAIPPLPSFDDRDFAPRPQIEHGGSVTVTFPAVHLRPLATQLLNEDHVLVLGANEGSTLRGTWRATATNRSGVAHGALVIPVDPEPVDLTPLLSP